MSRTALVLLACAVVSLPTGVSATQEPIPASREHRVASGETLWSLAARYLGDGTLWRRLVEANPALLQGPEDLAPGMLLRIPGPPAVATDTASGQVPASIGGIAVSRGGEAPAAQGSAPVPVRRVQAVPPDQPPPPEPGLFRDRRPSSDRPTPDESPAFRQPISPGIVARAPFVIDGANPAQGTDSIAGVVRDGDRPAPLLVAREGDRLRIDGGDGTLAPGARLQAFATSRIGAGETWMGRPTAVLVVVPSPTGTPTAVVERIFDRIEIGQRVRPLPPLPAFGEGGVIAVSSGLEAGILGAAREVPILGTGEWVFLDAGADAGHRPGDEIVPAWVGDASRPPGRLQVVAVGEATATARVLQVGEPVFRTGLRVRLDRRIR